MSLSETLYKPNGERIWKCTICDCTNCVYKNNESYDAEKCKFRTLTCGVCKGRHCMTMCPDYKEKKT